MSNQGLIIVSGPTASGKSALAMRVATALSTDIINIDSVQTYSELQIGAAKPSSSEREAVKHHLLDIFAPNQVIDAAAYCERALSAIAEISAQNKQALFCGGSTLYISALLGGLADLPPSCAELRAELECLSSSELYARLESADAQSAKRLHPNDRVRVIRALESSLLLGKRASDTLGEHNPKLNRFGALIILPVWDRESLYARINRRAEEMLSSGLIAEVQKLAREYGESAQALRSLGYSQSLKFLAGKIDQHTLLEEIKMHTRRFAKRQLTFWRNEPAKRGWSVRPDSTDQDLRILGAAKARPSELIKELSCLSLSFDQLLSAVQRRLGVLAEEKQCEVWFVDGAKLVQ